MKWQQKLIKGERTHLYEEWNKEIQAKLEELKAKNPGATIIPPGHTKGIDGKIYWNDRFIIAK
ncbi:hypothetical protein LCGC14_1981610 [marine sediment metagenome]|uniref:Uncharacterized protein n=1 Tax=marine sediment metagenome TaxID=412755 RepID=A0A0F9F902_9ZZZZ